MFSPTLRKRKPHDECFGQLREKISNIGTRFLKRVDQRFESKTWHSSVPNHQLVQIYLLEEHLASFPDGNWVGHNLTITWIVVTKSNTQISSKEWLWNFIKIITIWNSKISREDGWPKVRRFVTIWNHKDSRRFIAFYLEWNQAWFIYGGYPTSKQPSSFSSTS